MESGREQQLGGVHALHLNTILFPLIRLAIQRRKKRQSIKRIGIAESQAAALDACMGHPLLHSLGRVACEGMLKRSVRRPALANESVLYFNEAPQTAGILICVSGSLKSRCQNLLKEGADVIIPDHSRPAGEDYTRVVAATEWEVRGLRMKNVREGVPVVIESELSAPNVVGCSRALQEANSPEHVTAITPCDMWVIPFDVLHEFLRDIPDPKRSLFRECRLRTCEPLFPLSTNHLLQSWIFSKVSPRVLEAIGGRMVPWVLMPREVLVSKGDPFRGIHILRRGTLRLKELGEDVSGFVIVGERGAIFGESYGSTVEAQTCCDVWSISSDDMAHHSVLPANERDTVTRVGSFYYEQWLRDSLLDATKRSELHQVLMDAFRRVPYLQQAPESVIEELVSESQPRVFTPLRAVASTSEECAQLLIITKGTCSFQVHGDAAQVLGKGSAIGWECPVKHRWMRPVCTSTMVEAWVVSRRVLIKVLDKWGMLAAAKSVCSTHLSSIAAGSASPLVPSIRSMIPKRTPLVPPIRDAAHSSPFSVHALDGNINFGIHGELQALRTSSPYPTYRYSYRVVTPHQPLVKDRSPSPTSPLASVNRVSSPHFEPVDDTNMVHVHPFLYLCVSNAECLGEWSPWLACLLGRRFRSFGYLGLSTPLPGTMVFAEQSSSSRNTAEVSSREIAIPVSSQLKASKRTGRNMRFTYAPHLPKGDAVVDRRVPLPSSFVQGDDALIARILAGGTADLRVDERRGLTVEADYDDLCEDDWRVAVEGKRVKIPVPRSSGGAKVVRVESVKSPPTKGLVDRDVPTDDLSSFVKEYDGSLQRANRRLGSTQLTPRQSSTPRRVPRAPRSQTVAQEGSPRTPVRPSWAPKVVPRPSASPRSCSGQRSQWILPQVL